MASGTTSIWGRPYPLSTDTPNVHTDIQALADSLDVFPLYPSSTTVSVSAVAGLSYTCSAGVTLTLPVSPVKGDTIRAVAASGATGTSPVTVTASGGKGINGVGLSVASSFTLGIPFAHATLQYDGANWQIIDGQQDTGWVRLMLGTGIATGASGSIPAARLKGDWLYLKGSIKNNSGNSIGNGYVWATLPTSAMYPPVFVGAMATDTSGNGHWNPVWITSSGTIGIGEDGSSAVNGQAVSLHSVSVPLVD